MNDVSRRQFLADVGKGMLVAGLGANLARDIGLSSARADVESGTLTFGSLEPLVCMMQETPANQLLPLVMKRISDGTDLKSLVAAGALANARTFGGQDYDGYHALMALAPAYEMSRELPVEQQALPIMKVLYRNTSRIQQQGGRQREVLKALRPAGRVAEKPSGELLREATRRADASAGEIILSEFAPGSPTEAFHAVQYAVRDDIDVHRVVLSWRAWALLDFTGPEQARTLLRQSVRYCAQDESERKKRKQAEPAIRALLPKLLDQYKLPSHSPGDRKADDGWIDQLAQIIYSGGRERAADAVAAALAEGMSPEAIGEAMSIAACRLVLCDPGRAQGSADKPKGSVHGASVGVHASDAANAWRNIARVSNPLNTVASLIVGAYHTAGQSRGLNPQSLPLAEHLEDVKTKTPGKLLQETEDAIKAKDQIRACAMIQRYGDVGGEARPVFDLMLRYACSEDGALHAEKYYRTVTEEYGSIRKGFRWQQLVALARVTTSEFGFPAPGYQQAKELLRI